ncbi:MAG: hypothetical protein KDC26_06105 [Armatimonadetes bacterium]|nr:hypothetical protein [Armatimonadota bacterium]
MNMFFPLADLLDPGTLALLIPIVAIIGGITTGVVKIFTNHQKEMARLMREDLNRSHGDSQALVDEIRALRAEVAHVRESQNQLIINQDDQIQERTQ